MANKRKAIEQLIQKATEAKIRKFESIRGKQTINFPYWDIVVITAADADQKTAYDLQLKEKLARHQLPLGIKYHILKDPGDSKIGPGGSMMAALSWLQTIYNQNIFKKKVLFIPAGGFSQRLPSASVLGKIFTAVPFGRPIYQMLELILAMYIDLPAHMDSGGIFLACADTIILYDCTVGVEWSFDKRGITAFGHPAPIKVGTTHGVFLLNKDKPQLWSQVHIIECEEFLHKRSADKLREKGALMAPSCMETLGISEEFVLVDSSYYMDGETAKKLIEFYEEKSPLTCEIDSHGDFLHGLGSRGSNTYIKDISNVCKKTDDLMQMRQDVYSLLQGTPLHVLVLPHSKFYHVGTTQELLYHFCDNTSLMSELSLSKDVFNRVTNGGDEQKMLSGERRKACVLNSVLPCSLDSSQRCIMEYSHVKSPCQLGDGSIVSNCVVQADHLSGNVTIPPNVFLHTVAVKTSNMNTSYVTIFFDIRDDLKRTMSRQDVMQLRFVNQTLEELFGTHMGISLPAVFPAGTVCSVWNAKFFPARQTMEESFQSAMTFLEAAQSKDNVASCIAKEECWSMADVVRHKDIAAMLKFRKQLYSLIVE